MGPAAPEKKGKGSQFGFCFTPITSHLEQNVIDRKLELLHLVVVLSLGG
jgi:hypothetical protein